MPKSLPNSDKKIRRNVQSWSETVDSHIRQKDFITEQELQILIKASNNTRYYWRNSSMLQLMFWHGLRVSELCNLRVSDVDLKSWRIFVRRLKGSLDTQQPILNDELRALKKYLNQRKVSGMAPLFLTERGTGFTRSGVYYLVRSVGESAKFPFIVHPHMFRHGCGYALANRGNDTRLIQDYLGHGDIKNTVRYSRTNAKRFENARQ